MSVTHLTNRKSIMAANLSAIWKFFAECITSFHDKRITQEHPTDEVERQQIAILLLKSYFKIHRKKPATYLSTICVNSHNPYCYHDAMF